MPGGRIHFLTPERDFRGASFRAPLLLTDPVLVPRPWPVRPPPAVVRDEGGAFCRFLLDEGVIAAEGLVQVLATLAERGGDPCDILRAQGLADEPALTAARARYHGLGLVDPERDAPDPALIDAYGPAECLRDGVLPWRKTGNLTTILSDRPQGLARHRDRLAEVFGPVAMALASREAMAAVVQDLRGRELARAAESRCAEAESCRGLGRVSLPVLIGLILFTGLSAAVLPAGPAGLASLAALLALVATVGLKTAALLAVLREKPAEPANPAVIARLPVVSLVVALYHEAEIAPRLARRLGRLDYPRELLDVILAVEADDAETRAALCGSDLPPWMRVVVVPEGSLKTKPRALNYALDFCRGSIVGVYDAEDAPEAGQIMAVVERFHQRGAEVACLQGVLDFYNPATNWMARCFTMEYATWFRIVLPGLDRLGLPLPLGGTTLFFRKAALVALGGWDAHNVTEDADLGMRLSRHGLRAEVIETATGEEANCRVWPWVRQRSRWIKGYIMTWRVHMRDPVLLWRQLGARGFLAFQILFLGSVVHALAAPLLLSFWLTTFGVAHPVADALPGVALMAMFGLFVVSEGLNLVLGVMALRRRPERINPLWLLSLGLYHPLAALAAYKALWELVRCPFYWDKTSHGAHDAVSAA